MQLRLHRCDMGVVSRKEKVLLYEGKAEESEEGEVSVEARGKVELSADEGENTVHNRGKETAYYLAWENEDLSRPFNRYRDEPEQKDYDWAQLGLNIAAGLAVTASLSVLASSGVGFLAEAGLIHVGAAGTSGAAAAVGKAGGNIDSDGTDRPETSGRFTEVKRFSPA